MKRASFEVAQAIKESGYPLIKFQTVSRKQFESGFGYKYFNDGNFYSESPSILHPEDNNTIDMYYCPTYIEVWLWLWEEKEICIEIKDNHYYTLAKVNNKRFHEDSPEEAIEQAIEYLTENDLIK